MDPKAQFVKEDHVKAYKRYGRPVPNLLMEKIISHLQEKYDGPRDVAVDVGCGSGQSTIVMAPFFKKVYGIDISEAQIKEAKESQSIPNVIFEVGPSESLPFDDESVQVVNAALALHWFHLDSFFPEVRRVLCNNGVLAVHCYLAVKPILNNPVLDEEVGKLYKDFYDLLDPHFAPEVKIGLDRYKNVEFPFEEVVQLDDVRDTFEGHISDIVGYVSSFSGFQNLNRHDEKMAMEYLSHFEIRLKEIVTEAKFDVNGTLKLYTDYFLIICRKIA